MTAVRFIDTISSCSRMASKCKSNLPSLEELVKRQKTVLSNFSDTYTSITTANLCKLQSRKLNKLPENAKICWLTAKFGFWKCGTVRTVNCFTVITMFLFLIIDLLSTCIFIINHGRQCTLKSHSPEFGTFVNKTFVEFLYFMNICKYCGQVLPGIYRL